MAAPRAFGAFSSTLVSHRELGLAFLALESNWHNRNSAYERATLKLRVPNRRSGWLCNLLSRRGAIRFRGSFRTVTVVAFEAIPPPMGIVVWAAL